MWAAVPAFSPVSANPNSYFRSYSANPWAVAYPHTPSGPGKDPNPVTLFIYQYMFSDMWFRASISFGYVYLSIANATFSLFINAIIWVYIRVNMYFHQIPYRLVTVGTTGVCVCIFDTLHCIVLGNSVALGFSA